MKITSHEKEQIKLIDEQIRMLHQKNASDETLLLTLVDFIPEVKCLIENAKSSDLAELCAKYEDFNYFLNLLEND